MIPAFKLMEHFTLFPAVVVIRSWPLDHEEARHEWQKTLWLSLSTERQTQAELYAKSAGLSKKNYKGFPSFSEVIYF